MFQCIECYLTKAEFQYASLIRSLYFLILTVYSSYLDQVLIPIVVIPFTYLNKAQKTVLKTLIANFMNTFHVGNACYTYKAFE